MGDIDKYRTHVFQLRTIMHNMVTLLSIDAYAANILSTKNSTLPDESVNEKLKFYPSFAKNFVFQKEL